MIEKFMVTKEVEWDMGHRVPNHKSKCHNPHGHRYRLRATVEGPLVASSGASDEGMVLDFGDLKSAMVGSIHDLLDHGTLIWKRDGDLLDAFSVVTGWANLKEHASADTGSPLWWVIPVENANNWKICVSSFIPTAENLSAYIFYRLSFLLNNADLGIKVRRVEVYETPTSVATFEGK